MFYALSSRIDHLIRFTYSYEFEMGEGFHSLSTYHRFNGNIRDWHEYKTLS